MSLMLTILTAPASVSITESSRTFDIQGGTIGRGKDNTWVLEDPERYLSSLHCQISNENGQFFITDLSTNGTFLNGAPDPMGKGNKLPLNDGDKFALGDYEFSVSLWSPVQMASPPEDESLENDPFAKESTHIESPFNGNDPSGTNHDVNDGFDSESGFGSSPFDTGFVSKDDSLFGISKEETDPLAALDKAQGCQGSDSVLNGSDPFSGVNSDNPFSGNDSLDPLARSDKSDPFDSSVSPAHFCGTNRQATFSGDNYGSLAGENGTNNYSDATFSDQADALNQQVTWPDSVQEKEPSGMIPDDWDDDLLSSDPEDPVLPIDEGLSKQTPATPSVRSDPVIEQKPEQLLPTEANVLDSIYDTLPPEKTTPVVNQEHSQVSSVSTEHQYAIEKANAKIEAELEILKQQIRSQQHSSRGSEITVDTSLAKAMGVDVKNLTDEQITAINVRAGEVIRESVKGLMQVLSSRSSIKNEFRMNVTTIQPVENNPLKFSVNVDDALENMFVKQGNAYKKPVEAIREGFDGIAEHQIAVIAGIRAAFRGVVERFDPIRLEQRFSKQNKGGLIPGSQKAKNWELYGEYFSELVGDMDNSFQYLFGDEFVQAYEDQLRKLAMARKSKTNAEDK